MCKKSALTCALIEDAEQINKIIQHLKKKNFVPKKLMINNVLTHLVTKKDIYELQKPVFYHAVITHFLS